MNIFNCLDLVYLYSLWNDTTTPDHVRIDVATQIDRIERYNKEKAKAAYNENEHKIIINTKYKEIIER